jgi:hypothetical protein
MDDMSKAEALKAAHEARERAGSSRGSWATTVEAAMRRYLSAEEYRQLAESAPPGDEQEPVDRGE